MNNGTKYTTMKLFMWVIAGLFSFIIGACGFLWQNIQLLEIKVSNSNNNIGSIKVDVATIKTDVSWIKTTLENYEIEQ